MLLGQAIGCRPSAVGEDSPAFPDSRQPTADGPRLITLTGTGGCGKSRLALEVVRQVSDLFAGAVWFVSLADVSSPELILDKLARALPLPGPSHGQPLEAAIAVLAHQPSLLLLDNFE